MQQTDGPTRDGSDRPDTTTTSTTTSNTATPPTHEHRGLHWRWLLNGAWTMRERGNEWIVCEDAAGWRVTYYPFGGGKEEPWAGPDCGRTVWPTVEAAMDAVADRLAVGAMGAWI